MLRYLIVLGLALAGFTTRAEEPLFEYEGRTYAPEQLSTRMLQLYGGFVMDKHRELRALVDEMVFDVYVQQEAERQGKDVRQVGAALLQVPEPDEAEVRNFYAQNQARMGGQTFDQIKERLRSHLHRQAMLAKREEVLGRIKSEGDFRLLVTPPAQPRIPLAIEGRPFKGSADAKVTVVEFADYQCPQCKRASALMNRLLELYPGALKIVYMDFPINASGISRAVAHGGVCAHAQGRFWPYHDLAYARQAELTKDAPMQFAETLGMDTAAFAKCLADPATAATVSTSYQQARQLGLKATPALFVDGRPFPSEHLLRDLGEYIDRKLARQG